MSYVVLHCISSVFECIKVIFTQNVSYVVLHCISSVFQCSKVIFTQNVSYVVLHCISSVFECIRAIYGQCQPEPKGATNPSALRQQTLLNTAVVYFLKWVSLILHLKFI